MVQTKTKPEWIWILLLAAFMALFFIVSPIDRAQAKHHTRKAVKKQMTQAERKAYKKDKAKLTKARKKANAKKHKAGEKMIAAKSTFDRYIKAERKARAALSKQRKKLEDAEKKTGLFKPSKKKLASLTNRYNKAVDTFNNGPLKNVRDKQKELNSARDAYKKARTEASNSVNTLAKHRLGLGGKIKQLEDAKLARQVMRGSFMTLKKGGELKALNYDKIPALKPESHYDKAPAPAQIYTGFN